MKTSVVKVAACCLFNFTALSVAKAGSSINVNDTSVKSMAYVSMKEDQPYIVVKKANVVYPAILSEHEEQSVGYVEKFSQARKDYLIRTFNRSKKLFPKAVAILKKYNIPSEFRVLLALESGFNANAVSKAGAVGYWQFMDEVAREYGLKIETRVKAPKIKSPKGKKKKQKTETVQLVKTKKVTVTDDRRNFLKSTHAAARYLKDRGRNLNNDWLLIAASYNCGVGNVWNAMERTGKANPTFWDIKDLLPAETRTYVMNFIALNVVFHNYEAFTRNKLCFRDEISSWPLPEEELCEEEFVTAANDY